MKTAFTISIPEYWASRFGGGKNQGYEAARNGTLPTIEIGGRKYVPVRKADAKFGFADQSEAA